MLKLLVLASIAFLVSGRGLPMPLSSHSQLNDVFRLAPPRFPVSQPLACDISKLSSCGQAFFKEIGYAGDPANYQAFAQFVNQKYISQGVKGFDQFCTAVSDAEKCYGDGFIDCITSENLQSLGLDKQTATNYAVYFHQTGYDCGPGKKVFDDNWDCIVKTASSHATEQHEEECVTKFQHEVQKDPQNLCKYGQEFLTCESQPYSACGPDVENALCNSVSAGFSQVFDCKFTCSKRFPQPLDMSKFMPFVPKEPPVCDVAKLKDCCLKFGSQLGYKGDPTDYEAFFKFLDGKYGQSRSGFDTFCGILNDTKLCYGKHPGAGLIGCLSVANLEAMGLDKQVASVYAFFFHEQGWNCGPGHTVIDNDYDCMNKVRHDPKTASHSAECAKTYNGELQKDPKNYCKYTSEYAQCMSQPFNTCGAEAGGVACHANAFALEALIPNPSRSNCRIPCRLSCSL